MLHPPKAGVANAAAAAQRALKGMARPAGDFDSSRYFRAAGDLGFHNVGTTAMRALARDIYDEHRDEWTIDDAMAFADRLIVDRFLETKAIGI